MRRIFLSATVLAMLAASCQNEEIVGNKEVQQGGEFVTLTVNRSVETRTQLGDNNKTLWSEGDQIYVTGKSGKVTGVLTLKDGADENEGLFEGFIFGGNELEYVVFPVPEDGVIDMMKRDGDKLDNPMIGTVNLSAGTASLNNVGGLVAFESDMQYPAKATVDGKNLAAGAYTFDPSTGTLKYREGKAGDNVPTYFDENSGLAYLPVATTFEANNGDNDTPISNVTVEVMVNGTPVSMGGITVTPGEIYGDDDNEDTSALDVKLINDANGWYNAFANGGTYKLTESFTVEQKVKLDEGKTLTILGNGNALTLENGETEGIKSERDIYNNGNLTLSNLNLTLSGEALNGIYSGDNADASLILRNCNITGTKQTFVRVDDGSNAEIVNGRYAFDGTPGKSMYAIGIMGGSTALICTTVNGGDNGGGLTIQGGSNVNITGTEFQGGEKNYQHGLHIMGATVNYVVDANKLSVDDVYVQTKHENDGTNYTSIVNGATFEGGVNYGVATGFKGTMKALETKIEELKNKQQIKE